MSGIIGGAGSKSGVIGTTELDYEEGTWTPAYGSSSGSFTSITYNTTLTKGTYIKVGKLVHIQGYIRTNARVKGSADGAVHIDGLPFPATSVTTSGIAVAQSQNFYSNNPIGAHLDKSQTKMFLLTRDSTGGVTYGVDVDHLGGGTSNNIVSFGGAYMTD
jgi:hypothetical protein